MNLGHGRGVCRLRQQMIPAVSKNPHLELDKPWNWICLSRNPRMLITKAEEVTRIQRRWRACNTDPSHPVCQKRECDDFSS